MLKIGDFAKLSRVSIRMLRHYDEVGLLKPDHVDAESSYRYYSAQQLPRLNRILALQDLGFTLEQIGSLLKADLSPEQLKGMLRTKQMELQDRLQAEQERLARVAWRLQQIEIENQPPAYDVVIKQVPPQLVAASRGTIASHQGIGALFGTIFQHLEPYRVGGLAAAIWHDDVSEEQRIDAEAAIYLRSPLPPSREVQVYELPEATMACVVHHGAFLSLNRAYESVVTWIEQHNYQIVGPNRELYIHYTLPSRQDDENYVTELQFPVERI
jgi:DNA-binding transcriptional MerR regulator